jgi:hypothetical protein
MIKNIISIKDLPWVAIVVSSVWVIVSVSVLTFALTGCVVQPGGVAYVAPAAVYVGPPVIVPVGVVVGGGGYYGGGRYRR